MFDIKTSSTTYSQNRQHKADFLNTKTARQIDADGQCCKKQYKFKV